MFFFSLVMVKLTEKTPKSAAERKCLQNQREKQKDPEEYRRKENERLRLLRRNQKAKMSASELNEKGTKDRARQALYRQKRERGKSKKQCGFTLKS